MELALTLGFWGWIAVIVGALAFGVLAQSIGETRKRLRVDSSTRSPPEPARSSPASSSSPGSRSARCSMGWRSSPR